MRVCIHFYNFIFLISFPFMQFPTASGNKDTATSGPYRSVPVKIQKCEKTSYPIDKDPPLEMMIEIYNSSTKNFLLRGNLTVLRENKQVKLKMKSYIWKDGKWKLTYLMNNIGCHGVLLHTMMMAMGLKYNREICGFDKGKYNFQDIDSDAIHHIWASKMDYGKILWISETIIGSNTNNCLEFETLVVPAIVDK